MATEADINAVRENTATVGDANFTDIEIGASVDEYGIDVTSAAIWRRKAAEYADLVDVSEAGSSHKFSDLHKNALEMAETYDKIEAAKPSVTGRVRVKKIVRS